MRIVLGWLITPFYGLVFHLLLLVFHVLQVAARHLFGYEGHKKVVDAMLGALLLSLRLTGARVVLKGLPPLPTDRPLIIVSNHQSEFDVPLIGWLFRQHHPKYVSKMELAKGIPSISYNLRHGGSVCIDRKDVRQSLPALKAFGEYLEANNYAGCIFAEGTRARDGQMKPFRAQGVSLLLKASPRALVVPVAIDGAWELMRYRLRPIPFGVQITCTALPPVDRTGKNAEEIVREAEMRIREHLGQPLPVQS